MSDCAHRRAYRGKALGFHPWCPDCQSFVANQRMRCPLCGDPSFLFLAALVSHLGNEHKRNQVEIDELLTKFPVEEERP